MWFAILLKYIYVMPSFVLKNTAVLTIVMIVVTNNDLI